MEPLKRFGEENIFVALVFNLQTKKKKWYFLFLFKNSVICSCNLVHVVTKGKGKEKNMRSLDVLTASVNHLVAFLSKENLTGVAKKWRRNGTM